MAEKQITVEFKVVSFERLPGIHLRIRAKPLQCLKRFNKLLRANKALKVRSTFDGDGELHCNVVSFVDRNEKEHEGLYAMIVHWNKDGQSLRLQLAAHRWNPDPPTYDSYVAAARRLFQPAIDAYNRDYGTRHRMRIETREELQPRLTPKAKEAFNRFVGLANKSSLHPSDWDAFYRFVYVCHRTRLRLYEDEIRWFCRRAGFSREQASDLSSAFEHCSNFYQWLRKRW